MLGKNLGIIGTYSGQSDLYTWIVTNHNIIIMTKDQSF